MPKRLTMSFLALCFALSLAADTNPPALYIGGQRLFVGMLKSEAVAALSSCCNFSPPADSANANAATGGHFIVSKEEPTSILGTVWFDGGRVSQISRPIDENIDPQSADVVAFARALDRTLSRDTDGAPARAIISVRHERMENGDGEFVTLSFANGRGLEIQIATLDNAGATGKRDFVSLNETLQ